jgi:hypothetical protein
MFYFIITLVVLLALAIFAGAGYLVYRAGWGGSGSKAATNGSTQENTLEYCNQDIGFTFSYMDDWNLEQDQPGDGQLVALKVSLSSQKNIEFSGYQLDPVVSIGGLDGIRDFLTQDATNRISALGGSSKATGSSSSGSDEAAADEQADAGTAKRMFTQTQVNGLPVFYLDFNANVMGEPTTYVLYYVVADDYYFLFQGRSPQNDYKDMRPQIMATAGSFQWTRAEVTGDESGQ